MVPGLLQQSYTVGFCVATSNNERIEKYEMYMSRSILSFFQSRKRKKKHLSKVTYSRVSQLQQGICSPASCWYKAKVLIIVTRSEALTSLTNKSELRHQQEVPAQQLSTLKAVSGKRRKNFPPEREPSVLR